MTPSNDTFDKEMHKSRALIGSEPGTLVLPDNSPPPTIRLTRYGPENHDEHAIASAEEIKPWLEGSDTVWVDVQGLGDEKTLMELGEVFGLHPLALEDIVHVPQRPKTQAYENHQLIFTRMLTGGADGEVGIEQITLVLGTNYVVTFQERPGDVLGPVRRRLATKTSKLRTSGADYLAYALLDTIVDAYIPVIEALGECIADLEELVFAGGDEDVLQDISDIRSTLLSVRRSVWPLRDAVNQLIREDTVCFGPEASLFLRDVYDHCVNAADMIETYRELGTSMMNSYLSVLSNRMNEVMKVLTVMSTIFIPLTFLSGLYGMNFAWMPEREWKWSYPLLLIVMSIIAASLLLFFRKRGWFK